MGTGEQISSLVNGPTSFQVRPGNREHVHVRSRACSTKYSLGRGQASSHVLPNEDFLIEYTSALNGQREALRVGPSRRNGVCQQSHHSVSVQQCPHVETQSRTPHVPLVNGFGASGLTPAVPFVGPVSDTRKLRARGQPLTLLDVGQLKRQQVQQLSNFLPQNRSCKPPISSTNNVLTYLASSLIKTQQYSGQTCDRSSLLKADSHHNSPSLSTEQQLVNAIQSLHLQEHCHSWPRLPELMSCGNRQQFLPSRYQHQTVSSLPQSSASLLPTPWKFASNDDNVDILSLSAVNSKKVFDSSFPKDEKDDDDDEDSCIYLQGFSDTLATGSSPDSGYSALSPSPLLSNSGAPTTPRNNADSLPSMFFDDQRWKPTASSPSEALDDVESLFKFGANCETKNPDSLARSSCMSGVVTSDVQRQQATRRQGPLPVKKLVTHCTWCGELTHKYYEIQTSMYSTKVFLGGVPWDITESILLATFHLFGLTHVEWPGKEGKHRRHPPKGYVYLLFDSEISVKNLLNACREDIHRHYFFAVSSRRSCSSEVEVIPWNLADSSCIRRTPAQIDANKTVFIGGLHGLITADDLGLIMNDLFGGVIYAGIDSDSYKYPIGSGRVTFGNWLSYTKAVMAGLVEIKTSLFNKKVQINPYLEDSVCCLCGADSGPLFCRDQACFRYFCQQCWQWHHSVEWLRGHEPITRDKCQL